jgi:rifampin ADP-ribosylating transferase
MTGGSNKVTFQHPNFIQSYFHGTKVNLSIGDLVVPGNNANYGERKAKFVYASSNLNVAIWGAELAVGDGPERIYVVEPLGPIENDPNLTDKKFPGNPTNSFRAREGFKVVAEVKNWQGHSPEEIRAARDKVELALKNGTPVIED